MSDNLFRGKYRIRSSRLRQWNYSQSGSYFVTICTKDGFPFLGEVRSGKMILNEVGIVTKDFWLEIPRHFDVVVLDEFIVMPNHVHGVIRIKVNGAGGVETCHGRVETCHGKSLQPEERKFASPVKNSLSMVVNHYKGSVTREIRKNGYGGFSWQSRFYDHVIRNEESLAKIRNYIRSNPQNWSRDKYYLEI